ncbi:MAG: MFS transporter, partial [Candidatus Hydrogenedentota bacterium]
FFIGFWMIAPILIPFYRSNGLNATQVFTVQAIFLTSVLIFEIPSGYLSDVIGRRKTLILSSMALPIGLCIYAFSYGFWGFAMAECVLGVAVSLWSGTDSALIYDTLVEMGREAEYKQFEGKASFFHRVGDSISSVLGGLFAVISLRLPFYINIGTALILIPLAVLLVEPERKKLAAETPFEEIMKIFKYCMTHAQMRTLVMYWSLLFSSGMIGVWSYYIYYGELDINIGFYGIIFAIFCLCSAYGSRQAHLLERKFGEAGSLYFLLLISPVFIALGQVKSIFMLPFIFLNAFIWGFSRPLFADYVNRLVESDIRATVLSVANMLGSLSFVILSPVFGRLVDSHSLSFAYITLGAFFLLVGLLSLFLLHKHRVV